ncbi:hexitol phosphatase HxpB [Pseudaeromonas sharmana]|uniref:Hexitol phosphatase HxpB n=1 Tax=Pseudaeromonas sharmana TaxID=328412 RepID=A0ABV8CPD3_9GAMM
MSVSTMVATPSLQAVIFDMDGVLIDSEPLWQQGEYEVFREAGVPLTPQMCQQTMGLRVDHVVRYWQQRYPDIVLEPHATAQAILDRVAAQIMLEGVPMPGVVNTLQRLHAQGITIGLATSSPGQLVTTILQKLQIIDYFTLWHSAEHEPYGKPHPAVYLSAAERLGVAPQHCLAIEDSLNGLLAAKSAGMSLLAVPDHRCATDPRWVWADYRLDSLEAFDDTHPLWSHLATSRHP